MSKTKNHIADDDFFDEHFTFQAIGFGSKNKKVAKKMKKVVKKRFKKKGDK